MDRRSLPLLVLFVAAASPAGAAELLLGWDSRLAWESNIFNSSEDQENDGSVRLGPDLQVREEQGNLTYDAEYQFRFENFFKNSDVRTTDHFFSGAGEWRITPRTSLSVSNNFFSVESLLQAFLPGTSGLPTGGETQVGNERVVANAGQVQLTHALSPLWKLIGSATPANYWYDADNRLDSTSLAGAVQAVRTLTPRMSAGGGLSWTRQDFEDPGRGSTFYQGFGTWQYQVEPGFTVTLQGGPAWTVPDAFDDPEIRTYATLASNLGPLLVSQPTCPLGPDGTRVLSNGCSVAGFVRVSNNRPANPIPVDQVSNPLQRATIVGGGLEAESSLNFFGLITIQRTWQTVTGNLSYQRSASAASGLGTSTDLDRLSGLLQWTPDRAWLFELEAAWERQTSASEVPSNEVLVAPVELFVDASGRILPGAAGATYRVPDAAQVIGLRNTGSSSNAIEQTVSFLEMRATRRLSRRTSLIGTATWRRQDTQGDLQADLKFDNFRFQLGLLWAFDPIPI